MRDALPNLTAPAIDARGGFVTLGSLPVDLPYGEAGLLDNGCAPAELLGLIGDAGASEAMDAAVGATRRGHRRMARGQITTGETEAARLLALLRTHATFQIGAQFAVSRTALLTLFSTPLLMQWVHRTAAVFDAPSTLPSSAQGYTLAACCKLAGRTCLPWIWERTWQTLFHLVRLHAEAQQAPAETPGMHGLARLLAASLPRWRQLKKLADIFGAERRSRVLLAEWIREELFQLKAATSLCAASVSLFCRARRVACCAHAIRQPWAHPLVLTTRAQGTRWPAWADATQCPRGSAQLARGVPWRRAARSTPLPSHRRDWA